MEAFQLTILNEQKIIFKGKAAYCSVTTPEGEIGFKPGHEDFICTLAPRSAIRFNIRNGNAKEIPDASGVFMFRNNSCTITCSTECKDQ